MTNASTFLTLAILGVACILIYNTNQVSAQCGGSVPALVSQCSQYVSKNGPTIAPSAGCCTEVRKFDVPCACKLVTKDVEKLVSVPKAIFVARYCGLKLTPGMHCGSIIIPPKAMK